MATSSTISLSIAGMSCSHCVAAVTRALGGVPGVVDPGVTIGSARFSVAPDADPRAVQAAAIRAIQQEGYQVNGEAALASLRMARPDDSRTT
ncbi:MAG: heavy-metal-associated domain-containing protein [Gemmatimonadaceae bacterium]